MAYRTRRRGFVASAVTVGFLLAVSNGHAATGHAAIPDGNAYTPSSWAGALLSAGGWPQTACNLGAVEAWERAEGGNWENSAAYNPLDTTQPEPGPRR